MSDSEIPYYSKYIIDACVLIAYFDPEEKHHNEAVNFFKALDKFLKEGKNTELILPAHIYLEVNLTIEKKKSEVKDGKRNPYNPRTGEEQIVYSGYPVSLELMTQIEEMGIYELFGTKLRMGDFLYASICRIESLPLVTLDRDFEKVSDMINVIFLI